MSTDNSDSELSPSFSTVALLPLTALGALALVEKAAVATTIEQVFGTGLVATTIIEGLWALGLVTALGLTLLVYITVALIAKAILDRSTAAALLAFITLLVAGVSAGLGQVFFGSLPLLVGFILGANLVIYTALGVVGATAVVSTIFFEL